MNGHLYFEKSFTPGADTEYTFFLGFGVGFIVGKVLDLVTARRWKSDTE